MKRTPSIASQATELKPLSTHGDIQQYNRITKRSLCSETSVASQKTKYPESIPFQTEGAQNVATLEWNSEEPLLASKQELAFETSPDNSKRRKIRNVTPELRFSSSTHSTSDQPFSTDVPDPSQPQPSFESIFQSQSFLDTPPTTPPEGQVKAEISEGNLPKEVLDLLSLNLSFLKALSLHYAHHGAISPVDTRTLRSVVTKIWGERAVTLEDIQRCIGIMQSERPSTPSKEADKDVAYFLSDYGKGKICIERPPVPGNTVMARHLDVEGLQDKFEGVLCQRWDNEPQSRNITAFIAQLPLAPIAACPSLARSTTASHINGQRRLEDLKGIALNSRSSSCPPPASPRLARTVSALNHRRNSLLKRLKSKEADRAAKSAAPSPAELARRAALGRLPDIIATLPLPRIESFGSQRVSYALPMLVQTVQDSSRSVVGKKEVEGSLRLLADEGRAFGAEGFVRFVGVGLAEAVVVDWSRWPGDLMERVRAAT